MPVLMSANLGRHVDAAEFLANVRTLDDEAGAGTIIGFQEIDEADQPNEHHGLRQVLDGGFDFAGWDTRVPIAYGHKWRKVDEDVVRAARGLARLSPARVITETLLEHDSGSLLAVLNLHFPRNDPRLLTRWFSVERKLQARLASWYDGGVTAVWTADANRVHIGPQHPGERTLAHKGLDWIRCVEHQPAGTQLQVVESGLIDLTIDGHDAPWVRVTLSNPKEHR